MKCLNWSMSSLLNHLEPSGDLLFDLAKSDAWDEQTHLADVVVLASLI